MSLKEKGENTMSKTLDQLSMEDVVINSLKNMYSDHDDNFEHETEDDYAPYGNTYACTGHYITEESEIRCREAFKQDFDVDKFIEEYLTNDYDFRQKLREYVEQEKF